MDGIGDRDHWLCHLCFSGVNPTLPAGHFGSKTLDHLLPVSEGGAHAIENVYLAHLGCNRLRGNREVGAARRDLALR